MTTMRSLAISFMLLVTLPCWPQTTTWGSNSGTGQFTVNLSGAPVGPPNYFGSCVLLTALAPTATPFSGLTGAGTKVTDPEPASSGNATPCFHNPITRVTDAATSSNKSFGVPGGGSGAESAISSDSTTFLIENDGNSPFVYSLNVTTMISTLKYSGTTLKIPKGGNYSKLQANIFYSLTNSGGTNFGTLLQSSDFNSVTVPTKVTLFDFASSANCLQAQGSSPTWADPPDVNEADDTFSAAYSYTGSQGSAIYVAVWNRTKGCMILNTSTGQVTSDAGWGVAGYVCGTPPCLTETYTIHNVKISDLGDYAIIQAQTCLTTCTYSGSPYAWHLGTLNVVPLAISGNNTGGHWHVGRTLFVNGAGSPSGQFTKRLLATPASFSTVITAFPVPNPTPTFDGHSGWNNVDAAETYAWYTTTTRVNTFPDFSFGWMNEILLIFPSTGVVRRCGHTYSTPSWHFNSENAIGSMSKDGRFYLWSSTMNDSLGSKTGGASCTPDVDCRGDVFITACQ